MVLGKFIGSISRRTENRFSFRQIKTIITNGNIGCHELERVYCPAAHEAAHAAMPRLLESFDAHTRQIFIRKLQEQVGYLFANHDVMDPQDAIDLGVWRESLLAWETEARLAAVTL